MKCPKCQHPLVLGWQRLRQNRRAKGLCVECGIKSDRFRCAKCRARAARNRKKQGGDLELAS